MTPIIAAVISGVACLVIGIAIGIIYRKKVAEKTIGDAEQQARRILEDGIKAAMEVLDTFNGRKIVLTPGLVELGKYENVMNLEFGKMLAKHADIVIIIGHHNAETIINGLLDGGMERENIKFAKSLNKGNAVLNEIMQAGDIVMFENDLPDNYS